MPDLDQGTYHVWKDAWRSLDAGEAASFPLGGRLRVLFIDDEPDPRWERDPVFDRYFVTVSVSDSASLQRLIVEGEPTEFFPDARGLLPADLYLADLNMCSDFGLFGHCASANHLRQGLHAPSAGLLMALLTAMRSPRHPQAIVPYSATGESQAQVWNVSQRFCPPAVHVVWNEAVTRGNTPVKEVRWLLSAAYRDALAMGVADAAVHIPMDERDRWTKRLAAASVSEIDAAECIELVFDSGSRRVMLGALFFDALDRTGTPSVPSSVVRDWISSIPADADPLAGESLALAQAYWNMRNSPVSRSLYQEIWIRSRTKHGGKDAGKESGRKGSASESVSSGSGTTVNDADAVPSGPAMPVFPSLLEWKQGKHGRSLVRLAFIYLLLFEYLVRLDAVDAVTDEHEEVRDEWERAVPRLQAMKVANRPAEHQPEINVDAVLAEVCKRLASKYEVEWRDTNIAAKFADLQRRVADSLVLFALRAPYEHDPLEAPFGEDDAGTPLSELAVIQLVDPLPLTPPVSLTLDTGKGLGDKLGRLWSSKGDSDRTSEYKLLLGGKAIAKRLLSESELLCARHFLMDRRVTNADWPEWLQ